MNNLPGGSEENIFYGTIGYVVPQRLYPNGYPCDPHQALPFMSLATQKNYISLYPVALHIGKLLEWFKEKSTKSTDKNPEGKVLHQI